MAAIGEPVVSNADRPDDSRRRGDRSPVHPIGWVATGVLVLAVVFHTVADTKYLIGNLAAWHWVGLVALVVLALRPMVLHRIRLFIESISTTTRTIAWILAWIVFLVQLFNVVTRYGNDFVERDILYGQVTSLAWQSFGLMFLVGIGYGVRDGVNPRIDFWWADFGARRKAWLDFVLHVFLLLPFIVMGARILRGYTAISLGQKRDGTWPSGWRVWNTWEKSAEAEQLPVGPIKAMMLVAFVLFGLQIVAEIIKTGFIMVRRDDLGEAKTADAPQRIE